MDQRTAPRTGTITRVVLTRALGVAALTATIAAPGVIGLTAADANAMPTTTRQTECADAGGKWHVEYYYDPTGFRYHGVVSCFYRDIG